MPPRSVAVIDVGSNTIKSLVAARAEDGSIKTLQSRAIEARISTGISHAQPQLSDEAMVRGLDAIRTLIADAMPFLPDRTIIVATSAVRDAGNGQEFRSRVKDETGLEVRVLTGTEEANLIGRGLTSDPALAELKDYYVFDLGGGSLEGLMFRDRKLEQVQSMQLGCVRLMEQFIADANKPLGRTARYRIMQHVHDDLVRGTFRFDLPKGSVAVGTGGTISTVRAILGARDNKTTEETDSFIPLTQIRLLLTRIARMPLEERQKVPGLPAARADIFPTALAILIVLADVGAFEGFRHSFHNLRYGLAAEAFAGS